MPTTNRETMETGEYITLREKLLVDESVYPWAVPGFGPITDIEIHDKETHRINITLTPSEFRDYVQLAIGQSNGDMTHEEIEELHELLSSERGGCVHRVDRMNNTLGIKESNGNVLVWISFSDALSLLALLRNQREGRETMLIRDVTDNSIDTYCEILRQKRSQGAYFLAKDTIRVYAIPSCTTLYNFTRREFIKYMNAIVTAPIDSEEAVKMEEEKKEIVPEVPLEEGEIECSYCGEHVQKDDAVEIADGSLVCKDCRNIHYVKCEHCDKIFLSNEVERVSGINEYWCSDCLGEDAFECAECDCWHTNDEGNDIGNGDTVCEYCYDNHFFTCDECGDVVHNNDGNYMDCNDRHVCDNCYGENYAECNECGRVLRTDDMEWSDNDDGYFCEDCRGNGQPDEPMTEAETVRNDYLKRTSPPKGVRGYQGNSQRCFFRQEDEPIISKYYGIEVEVDIPRSSPFEPDREECANRTLDILNERTPDSVWNYWMAKSDGSCSDNGFELISQPMTLRYIEENNIMGLVKDAFSELRKEGYLSHNTTTCGLHFHVSKNALSEICIANMLVLIDQFWDIIFKMSRRSESSIEQWSKRKYSANTSEEGYEDLVKQAKCSKSHRDRYVALNLTNKHTVELRVCRGTMKVTTIEASLRFFDYLTMLGETKTRYNIKSMSEAEFIQGAREYHSTIDNYFTARDIHYEV